MPALDLVIPHPGSERLRSLDELKGVGIILILLYHAGGVLIWNNYLHGDAGVDIFLVLSGIGLSFSSRQETAWSYFQRRVLRLMPTYWVVLAVYVAANTHFLQHHYSIADIAVHVLGLHALLGDRFGLSINDSFWFISLILFLYTVHWWLRPVMERLDQAIFWMGCISAAVALSLFFTGQSGLMGHVGFRVPSFFLGMLIGQLLRSGRIQIPMSAWTGMGVFLLAYVPYTRGITFYSALVALGLMGAYALVLRPRISDGSALAQVLGFLGRHSLEIFLVHQPLFREYNYYLHGRWLNEPNPSAGSLVAGMAIALTVTLVVSVELHRLQRVFSKA